MIKVMYLRPVNDALQCAVLGRVKQREFNRSKHWSCTSHRQH